MVNVLMLDTETVSMYELGYPLLRSRILSEPLYDIAVSVITVEEQLKGWHKNAKQAKSEAQLAIAHQNLTDNVRTLNDFHIVTFSEAAIRRCKFLPSLKLNVDGMDLRIAAIALEEDASVITRNLRDFERVRQLKCENRAD